MSVYPYTLGVALKRLELNSVAVARLQEYQKAEKVIKEADVPPEKGQRQAPTFHCDVKGGSQSRKPGS